MIHLEPVLKTKQDNKQNHKNHQRLKELLGLRVPDLCAQGRGSNTVGSYLESLGGKQEVPNHRGSECSAFSNCFPNNLATERQ